MWSGISPTMLAAARLIGSQFALLQSCKSDEDEPPGVSRTEPHSDSVGSRSEGATSGAALIAEEDRANESARARAEEIGDEMVKLTQFHIISCDAFERSSAHMP